MKEMQCKKCQYADMYVTSEYRAWGRECNVVNIWCKKKWRNVRNPYEKCIERRFKQKLTIDSYHGK